MLIYLFLHVSLASLSQTERWDSSKLHLCSDKDGEVTEHITALLTYGASLSS
jgi:hypothetical protein